MKKVKSWGHIRNVGGWGKRSGVKESKKTSWRNGEINLLETRKQMNKK